MKIIAWSESEPRSFAWISIYATDSVDKLEDGGSCACGVFMQNVQNGWSHSVLKNEISPAYVNCPRKPKTAFETHCVDKIVSVLANGPNPRWLPNESITSFATFSVLIAVEKRMDVVSSGISTDGEKTPSPSVCFDHQ